MVQKRMKSLTWDHRMGTFNIRGMGLVPKSTINKFNLYMFIKWYACFQQRIHSTNMVYTFKSTCIFSCFPMKRANLRFSPLLIPTWVSSNDQGCVNLQGGAPKRAQLVYIYNNQQLLVKTYCPKYQFQFSEITPQKQPFTIITGQISDSQF